MSHRPTENLNTEGLEQASVDTQRANIDMEMKHQGVTDDKLQLLREVTGSFRPGVLTALMGVSGAGKTALMDVLAGRKSGYIEGDMRISGYPKNQATFSRISGYCEQNDIHSPQGSKTHEEQHDMNSTFSQSVQPQLHAVFSNSRENTATTSAAMKQEQVLLSLEAHDCANAVPN
ncbi:hypothetical protein ABZP36_010345 [Zizania latifolia]